MTTAVPRPPRRALGVIACVLVLVGLAAQVTATLLEPAIPVIGLESFLLVVSLHQFVVGGAGLLALALGAVALIRRASRSRWAAAGAAGGGVLLVQAVAATLGGTLFNTPGVWIPLG